jgi:hypothetical protein
MVRGAEMKFTLREALLLTLLIALPLALGRYHGPFGVSLAFLPFACCAWRLTTAIASPLGRIILTGLAGATGSEVSGFLYVAFFMEEHATDSEMLQMLFPFWGFGGGLVYGLFGQISCETLGKHTNNSKVKGDFDY